jgi:hypothetical protein
MGEGGGGEGEESRRKKTPQIPHMVSGSVDCISETGVFRAGGEGTKEGRKDGRVGGCERCMHIYAEPVLSIFFFFLSFAFRFPILDSFFFLIIDAMT